MTKSLGTLLDYKGVPFSEALIQLRQNGVVFKEDEMDTLRAFLLEFHSRVEKN
jgi:hypothetical protein